MRGIRIVWISIVLAVVACGAPTSESSDATTSSVTTSSTVTTQATTTTKAPTTTTQPTTSTTRRADPAPPELEGSWHTDLGFGDLVTLTFEGTRYEIIRGGGQGLGDIKVVGGTIIFSGSNICNGMGTYRWSIDSEALTFADIELDPCKGRSDVLVGATYTR
jgi:hypothetical protein